MIVLPAPLATSVTLPAVRSAPLVVALPLMSMFPPVEVTLTLPPPNRADGWPIRVPEAEPPFSVTSPSAVTVMLPVCGVAELPLGPIAAPWLETAPPFKVRLPWTTSDSAVDLSGAEPMPEPPDPVALAFVDPVRLRLPLTVIF